MNQKKRDKAKIPGREKYRPRKGFRSYIPAAAPGAGILNYDALGWRKRLWKV
jgi:hypothetical protein